MSMKLKDIIDGSVSSNAGTATKLESARTINGTTFDGSANITTANWGTARNIYIADSSAANTGTAISVNGSGNVTLKLPATIAATLNGKATSAGSADQATKLSTARNIQIGNKTNSFNGTGNISYSLAEIGAAPIQTKSAATAATAQWYRIATSAASINNCLGLFEIEAAVSGKHSVTLVSAGISYGITNGVNLQQLSHTMYSATGISKARIVYHTSYNSNYAYLEVYLPSATATTITVNLVGGRGWTLVAPSTVGSIPSGYTSKEITFQANKIVSNVQGSVSGNAGTATKLQNKRTITIGNQGIEFDGSGNISFDLATIGVSASGHTHSYLPLSGGSISSSNFGVFVIDRTGSTNGASIQFKNTNGTLGYIGMSGAVNGGLQRWTADTNTSYTVLDTGNYKTHVTPDNIGAAKSSHGTHVTYSSTAPKVAGTAAVGSESSVARGDHVHAAQTSVSGNAGTATKLATARTITIGNKANSFDGSGNISYSIADIGAAPASHTHNYAGSSSAGGAANSVKTNLIIKLNGGSTEGTNLFTFNGGTAKTVNITPDNIGAAKSSHGDHVVWSTTAPKVAGTAAVGSETTVARGDHVHAAQTSVSGNAGTATKWKSAITLTIGNKGKSVDGSGNVKWTLTEIGASPLQKSVVSKATTDGKLTLSTDRYQKATLVTGNEIVLPTVSDFCEINLFVKDCSLANVILPDNCKWRVDPNLATGTSFIMTFIYTTQEWLAEIKVYS